MKDELGFFSIFISAFYLVGFGLLGYGLWSAHRSLRAANWPTVEGSITNVELVQKQDDGTTYKVQVEYSYIVSGQVYSGSRLAYGYVGSSTRETHEKIFTKLKNAKAVTVRYAPADPSTSTLSFGFHLFIKLMIAFAITWLAFVFGFTLLWWLIWKNDSILLQNLSVR